MSAAIIINQERLITFGVCIC